MAEEIPSLHIDTDWKKQAQAEKRKLAEQQAAAQAAKAPAVPPPSVSVAAAPAAAATGARKGRREPPPPGFTSLVQSVMTQVLYYLGEIAGAGGQPVLDLDMAKHHLDTLGMLEEKTKNNLTADEQGVLDAALYETRSRFISTASQLLGP